MVTGKRLFHTEKLVIAINNCVIFTPFLLFPSAHSFSIWILFSVFFSLFRWDIFLPFLYSESIFPSPSQAQPNNRSPDFLYMQFSTSWLTSLSNFSSVRSNLKIGGFFTSDYLRICTGYHFYALKKKTEYRYTTSTEVFHSSQKWEVTHYLLSSFILFLSQFFILHVSLHCPPLHCLVFTFKSLSVYFPILDYCCQYTFELFWAFYHLKPWCAQQQSHWSVPKLNPKFVPVLACGPWPFCFKQDHWVGSFKISLWSNFDVKKKNCANVEFQSDY